MKRDPRRSYLDPARHQLTSNPPLACKRATKSGNRPALLLKAMLRKYNCKKLHKCRLGFAKTTKSSLNQALILDIQYRMQDYRGRETYTKAS